MTFGNLGGFFVDFVGPAGDLMYGMSDNYYDPCPGSRVTVGVGERIPVVVRASGAVVVQQGQPVSQDNSQVNAVQVIAQSISVAVSQPSGASNPVRQNQPQSITQPQTIGVNPITNEVIQEFVNGGQSVGSILLTPKVVDAAAASQTLLKDGAKVINQLGQQIAVEVQATRQTAQLLSQTDDIVLNQLATQLRNNQGNLQSILQKSGMGFDDINALKNAMFSSSNTQVQAILQKNIDKVSAITKNLQTSAANIAVRACG